MNTTTPYEEEFIVPPPPPEAPGRGDRARTSSAPEIGDDGRPVIRHTSELHEVVDHATAAIATDDVVYQRDDALVHVVHAEKDVDKQFQVGTPILRRMAPATVRERLTLVARWERYDKRNDEWVPCLPSEPVVAALVARGQWRDVRPIIGIIETPAIDPSGRIIDTPGYDSATGYLYLPSEAYPAIPGAPTLEDAQRALAELREPFAEFPHRSEADRMVPVAAILSLIGRPAIVGSIPGFVFDAATPGSGKTLQTDTIAMVATGRSAARMNFPQGRSAEEELEKILAAYAIKGAGLINFDNVASLFQGAPLDRCITAVDTVELRVLGKSEVPTLRWRAVIVASGNNVVVGADTSRRVLVCRLDSELENPEERTDFAHPRLLDWVRRERPRLVCAALTLLKAFVRAGRPGVGARHWGSFETWAELVPAAIVWAGGADPMQTRLANSAEQHDPEKRALIAILDGLARLDADRQGLTIKTILEALYPSERLRGQPVAPDGFDDLREAIETLVPTPQGKQPRALPLGQALRRFCRRVVGGQRLDARQGRAGVLRWFVDAVAPPAPAEPPAPPEPVVPTYGPNGCPISDCPCHPCSLCRSCTAAERALTPDGCCC